jgi:iron-sulfur cluster assembly protein
MQKSGEPSMIEVTAEAVERIRSLLSEDGKLESHGLRMKVIGGGCSGLQYQLSFDDVVREVDSEIEVDGVKVIVDEKSALYLVGSRLNFVDTLEESGFKIDNPNASNTCGCGQSFAA